jgi:predicted AAA+ superfamily ATPase
MKYISRLLEATLDEYIGFFPAIAVLGPRQSGKSTLIKEYSYVLKYILYISKKHFNVYDSE